MKPAGLYSGGTYRESESAMSTTPYVLGIDLGTGGIRVLLVNQDDGDINHVTTSQYPSDAPRPGWSEQNPEDWWTACCQAIRRLFDDRPDLKAEQIHAIGISGQMHGLVALDDQDMVLRPAILWNDQRTSEQCDEIHRRLGTDRIIAITGKPVMTSFTAPKILWMQQHEEPLYRSMRHALLPKDYLLLRLSGTYSTDASDASGTSLLDLQRRDWSEELLQSLEIPIEVLPTVSESQEIVAAISSMASHETGLRTGTPIVAGAGDQAAGGVGCGIADDSIVSINLGTSGVVFSGRRTPPHDPSGALHGYCHAVHETWHVMGVMLSAGGSLKWYRDTFEPDRTFDEIIANASDARPGCGGLRFLPYLSGERTPHAAPNARGSFTGISSDHDRSQFARSVLEGVLFGLKDNLELIRAGQPDIEHVRFTGGGSRNKAWRQMAADIFNTPVATVNVADGSAYGAALLAMTGSGRFRDVAEAMTSFVGTLDTLHPTSAAEQYATIHEEWQSLYGILEPTYTG